MQSINAQHNTRNLATCASWRLHSAFNVVFVNQALRTLFLSQIEKEGRRAFFRLKFDMAYYVYQFLLPPLPHLQMVLPLPPRPSLLGRSKFNLKVFSLCVK